MKHKIFSALLIAAASAFTLTSCGSDDEDPGPQEMIVTDQTNTECKTCVCEVNELSTIDSASVRISTNSYVYDINTTACDRNVNREDVMSLEYLESNPVQEDVHNEERTDFDGRRYTLTTTWKREYSCSCE